MKIYNYNNHEIGTFDEDCDLHVSVGGDGSFLHMLGETKYSSKHTYAGINKGTLGYLLEYTDINQLISDYKNGNCTIYQYPLLTCNKYFALNDIAVTSKVHKPIKLDVYINGFLFEKYYGDGLVFCTSLGSTGYNKSLQGSLFFDRNSFEMSPISPINNKAYHSLINPIMLKKGDVVRIVSDYDMLITTDNNHTYSKREVEISLSDKVVNVVKSKQFNEVKNLIDKLIVY